MVKNSKEYQRDYMRKYNNSGEKVYCPACDKYIMKCRKYRHDKGKKHLLNINGDKVITVLESEHQQMKNELESLKQKQQLIDIEMMELEDNETIHGWELEEVPTPTPPPTPKPNAKDMNVRKKLKQLNKFFDGYHEKLEQINNNVISVSEFVDELIKLTDKQNFD